MCNNAVNRWGVDERLALAVTAFTVPHLFLHAYNGKGMSKQVGRLWLIVTPLSAHHHQQEV